MGIENFVITSFVFVLSSFTTFLLFDEVKLNVKLLLVCCKEASKAGRQAVSSTFTTMLPLDLHLKFFTFAVVFVSFVFVFVHILLLNDIYTINFA